MYLFINTADHKKMALALLNKQGGILALKNIKAEYQQSEKLLLAIKKIMAKCPSATSDTKILNIGHCLSGVLVINGPGGFTSLRIGVATANAIAWALQIPIVGIKYDPDLDLQQLVERGVKKIKKIKKFKQILPAYGKEPNINKK